jgi:hypothetical protein
VVVYVGGGNGIHLPTLARYFWSRMVHYCWRFFYWVVLIIPTTTRRMFPTTRFDVFDVKPLNSLVLGETSSR